MLFLCSTISWIYLILSSRGPEPNPQHLWQVSPPNTTRILLSGKLSLLFRNPTGPEAGILPQISGNTFTELVQWTKAKCTNKGQTSPPQTCKKKKKARSNSKVQSSHRQQQTFWVPSLSPILLHPCAHPASPEPPVWSLSPSTPANAIPRPFAQLIHIYWPH